MVTYAPGKPGIPPTWTSSSKSGVGTAFSAASRVWFTISHGILNEIYHPRIDEACTRDIGLIVTGPGGYFMEEKRHTTHSIEPIDPGVPAFRLVNTAIDGRFRIEKSICTDPGRDVALQHTRFITDDPTLRLFVLAAPHIGNRGSHNTARVDSFGGWNLLVAERDRHALAIASTSAWRQCSVGYSGASDGWADLRDAGDLAARYEEAPDGNVAMIAEIDLTETDEFTLAVGFGRAMPEAAHQCIVALHRGYDRAEDQYAAEWRDWFSRLDIPGPDDDALARGSARTLRCHESVSFPGGLIASLSIPWGFAKGDDDLGGYHLVWPRDLVEAAGGLLACGAHRDVERVLDYLRATQNEDGAWPQNMWLDGSPYWTGIQLDETALPVLLVDLWSRTSVGADPGPFWPMVRNAAGFIAREGPVTPQDRWEEDAGFAPFTLATSIAALLVAAEYADANSESALASFWRETADWWNENIERWTFVEATELASRCGVTGYYMRIGSVAGGAVASPTQGWVAIKNRPLSESRAPASQIVSPDALALVRFGLRRPDDPRVLDTITVLDAMLRVDLPGGPSWRRYTGDGYGEHEDGAPYDGTGVGRPWPLLTGERAHYELALGNRDGALELAAAVAAFASNGLIPEQVWDGPRLPDRELEPGRPTGSAMPLGWAHAEYLKLRRSLDQGRVFDLPPQTADRYLSGRVSEPPAVWRHEFPIDSVVPGRVLRIVLREHGELVWTRDDWETTNATPAVEVSPGLWCADLEPAGTAVEFTTRRPDGWEGTNHRVAVKEVDSP